MEPLSKENYLENALIIQTLQLAFFSLEGKKC